MPKSKTCPKTVFCQISLSHQWVNLFHWTPPGKSTSFTGTFPHLDATALKSGKGDTRICHPAYLNPLWQPIQDPSLVILINLLKLHKFLQAFRVISDEYKRNSKPFQLKTGFSYLEEIGFLRCVCNLISGILSFHCHTTLVKYAETSHFKLMTWQLQSKQDIGLKNNILKATMTFIFLKIYKCTK